MKAFKFLSKTAFVFSLVLLASCSSDNDIEETNEAKTIAKKIEFKANINLGDDSDDVTRATLEEDYSVNGEDGDQIFVYCDNAEEAVDFAITPSSIDGSTATFTNYGEVIPAWFDPTESYYALYPHASSTFNTQLGMITSVLPTNQTVSAGRAYDKKALFMTACADKDERIFNFMNIPALIKVTLKNNGDGKVKFVEIVSDSQTDNLSGNFRASAVYARNRINFEAISGAEKKHTVRLQITPSAESRDFFIAVLPGTINGFTLKFEDGSYKAVYERESSKKPLLKRSKIYDFGSYDVAEFHPEVK